MNQNLTVLFVCRITLKIMMDANRSYNSPEATVKMLISALTGAGGADSPKKERRLARANYVRR